MKKCIKFEQIADTRFGETKSDLRTIDKKLKKAKLNIIDESPIRESSFAAESYIGAKPSKQWRKTYIVCKGPDDKTWNAVYKKINKIKSVPFDSVYVGD